MVPPVADKVKHLQEFYQRLEQPGWNLKGCKYHIINLLFAWILNIELFARSDPKNNYFHYFRR